MDADGADKRKGVQRSEHSQRVFTADDADETRIILFLYLRYLRLSAVNIARDRRTMCEQEKTGHRVPVWHVTRMGPGSFFSYICGVCVHLR